jgi:hypothetical protein
MPQCTSSSIKKIKEKEKKEAIYFFTMWRGVWIHVGGGLILATM